MSLAFATKLHEKVMQSSAGTSSPKLRIDFDGAWDLETKSCLETALRARIGEPPADEIWRVVAASFGNFCVVLLSTSLQTHYSFCTFSEHRVESTTSQPARNDEKKVMPIGEAQRREVSQALNALEHALIKPRPLTTRERVDLLRKLCAAFSR